MKLWLDDVRPAPEGWVHVRTAEEAREKLLAGGVVECSLDHDLGYDGPLPGPCEECEGKGEVPVDRWQPPDQPGVMPCPACDGDGFIGGDILYVAADHDDDGSKLAGWMAAHPEVIPPVVTIHSWNPVGAERMTRTLTRTGRCMVRRIPYMLEEK